MPWPTHSQDGPEASRRRDLMKLRTTIAAGYFTVIGLVAVVGVVGLLGLYQYAGSVENGTAATRLSLAMGEVRALEWSALRGDLSASGEARDRLASIVEQFTTAA